jgi:glycosyltransferase involved in cell wall biosynthesis
MGEMGHEKLLANETATIEYLATSLKSRSPRVIWFQNTPDHYFSNMLDELNALGGAEYVGLFFSPPPAESVLARLPENSHCLFIGSGGVQQHAVGWSTRPMRPDAEKIIAAAVFDVAIVGGYDYPIKRWIIQHCRRLGRPVALFADSNIHAEFDGTAKKALKRFAKRLLLRRIIGNLDKVLCANSSGVEYWKYYGSPASSVLISTYYSYVCGATLPDHSFRDGLLKRCGLNTETIRDRRLLFTAARLVPAKGLHLMISAYRQLDLAAKGWVWVVAGTGPLEAELRQQAGELDNNGIYLVGVQPHDVVKGLAGQAEAFVLPSVYEPHGIVVSEAMGAGTPVIASDAAGAAIDLVEPGITGWLFRNGDAADLARVLKEATDDPDKLASMRPACRAKFEDWYGRYSPLVVVPKVVAELCGERVG